MTAPLLDLNARSLFRLTQALAAGMVEQGRRVGTVGRLLGLLLGEASVGW